MLTRIIACALYALAATGPGTPVPTAPPELPKETILKLVPFRDGIAALEENVAAGIITRAQADLGTERYLDLAEQSAGQHLSLLQFEALAFPATVAPAELTALQRFAGMLTFMNILWVLAIALGTLCFFVFFGSILIEIAALIPMGLYELLFYAGSLGLVALGTTLSAEVGPYVGLTGCLGFAGSLAFSAKVHNWEGSMSGFSTWCCAAWTAAAFVYGSQMIGFIAVMAFLSALGFSAFMMPGLIAVGFEDEAAVGRGTIAGFAVLGLYALLRVTSAVVPGLAVFESGALFMGSFVGYLGLLILSSRWYDGLTFRYALFNFITLVAGVGAIFLGSVYHIGELQKIGGTFFVIWALEKLFDIPASSVRGYSLLGLIASGAVYAFCMYVKSNPEQVRPYLFMFG